LRAIVERLGEPLGLPLGFRTSPFLAGIKLSWPLLFPKFLLTVTILDTTAFPVAEAVVQKHDPAALNVGEIVNVNSTRHANGARLIV
jgi:hypothetical protein